MLMKDQSSCGLRQPPDMRVCVRVCVCVRHRDTFEYMFGSFPFIKFKYIHHSNKEQVLFYILDCDLLTVRMCFSVV